MFPKRRQNRAQRGLHLSQHSPTKLAHRSDRVAGDRERYYFFGLGRAIGPLSGKGETGFLPELFMVPEITEKKPGFWSLGDRPTVR
ncbi:MAG: hypothetical protein GDA56_18020 [Hormoscilla sp. GM7CHS1pb]|nr:hypothetical protein [Hormoscilla sp. GM7CHS1pb]